MTLNSSLGEFGQPGHMGEYMLAVPTAEHAPLAGYLPDPTAPLIAPYRGISAFTLADAPIFFARADDIVRLTRSVAVYRGVLLYGESGVGKSSLINAGFVPAAVRQGFWPERLRVRSIEGSEILVERISASPDGGAPYLPSIFFADEPGDPREVQVPLSIEAVIACLKRLRLTGRTAGADRRRPGPRPLLIFDQFEESITLFEESPRSGSGQASLDVQRRVFDAIVDLLTDHTLPVKIVLSFREDYLAKLSKLIGRVPELGDHDVRVVAPDVGQLSSIMYGPLAAFHEAEGTTAAGEPRAEVARKMKDLAPRLEEEFRTRIGAGQMVPTEVQIACRELWESPDRVGLLEKGVQVILERFLDGALSAYKPELRDAGVALLSQMVTDSGTRNIISEVSLLDDVQQETGVPREQLMEILTDFDGRKTRLVRREEPRGIPFYTIVSEFLVPRIRDWRAEREAERRWARYRRQILVWGGVFVLVVVAVASLLLRLQAFEAEKNARVQEMRLRTTRAEATRANLELAIREKDDSLNRVASRVGTLVAESSNAVKRADSVSQAFVAGEASFAAALAAERTAKQSLERSLKQAVAEGMALRVSVSRNSVANQALRDSLTEVLSELRTQHGSAMQFRVTRDALIASRDRWLPVVLRMRSSRDTAYVGAAARAICAADLWKCQPTPEAAQ